MSIVTTGTLQDTNISPSAPLVNSGLRAIAATWKPGTTAGKYDLVLTNNFLYGLICNDLDISASSHEKIEVPLSALQGVTKRFISGETTGGSVTLNFDVDPETYLPYEIPDVPTSGGLIMEPHFCLFLGFLDATDPEKLIPYIECPVNIESSHNFNFPKNQRATGSLVFYQTGDGLRIGRKAINKVLAYTPPV